MGHVIHDTRVLPKHTILAGKYLVEDCLGRGGFGVTYRARSLQSTGDIVAIKEYFPTAVAERDERGCLRIPEDAADDFRRWQENYEREYRLLARLRGNRAIVNVREVFEENATSYLVMDFIPGQTLETQVLTGGPMSPEALLALLEPMLPELAKMHHAKVLHRDINPANIMLPPGDIPKLIDFGSARPLLKNSDRLTVLVRPGFAPPEQYASRSAQGPWTDVYGLCASLYFALTGAAPPDARQRMIQDDLKPLASLVSAPERLIRAITRGLSIAPEDRQGSFEALWHDLFGEVGTTRKEKNMNTKTEIVKPLDETAANAQPRAAEPVEHVKPLNLSGEAKAPRDLKAGAHCLNRIAAAKWLANIAKPINAEKYGPMIDMLDAVEHAQPRTAEQRVMVEEAIQGCGKCFALLCQILTRKVT